MFLALFSSVVFLALLISVVFLAILISVVFLALLSSIVFLALFNSVVFLVLPSSVVFLALVSSVVFLALLSYVIFFALLSSVVFLALLSLAKGQSVSGEGVAEILKQYGDWLYSKGDLAMAVHQYIKTIPHLEPSYVIKKVTQAYRMYYLSYVNPGILYVLFIIVDPRHTVRTIYHT